jgi:hypothetical protein
MTRAITLTVRDGLLVPLAAVDVALFLERFGEGELIETELRPVQSQAQKRFWAMINAAFKTLDGTRWDDAETFADALKVGVKFRRLSETISGTPYFVARSLAEVKDWEAFNKAIHDLMVKELGIDPAILAPPTDQSDDGRPAPETRTYEPTPKECLDKFMAFAEDDASWGKNTRSQGRLDKVDDIIADWIDAMPQHTDFIQKCGKLCKSIISGQVPARDARKLLMAALP